MKDLKITGTTPGKYGDLFDCYTGTDEAGKQFYNLVPHGAPAPSGGYYIKDWIYSVKGVEIHDGPSFSP